MLADGAICADVAVMDGGITPYQLPKPLTYLIGMRDWAMGEMGKHLSADALGSVFGSGKYGKDDLAYIEDVLSSMSARTIWRSFYSANNYAMPEVLETGATRIEYWYGADERRARAWDPAYIERLLPAARIREMPGLDHAEYLALHPREFTEQLAQTIHAGPLHGAADPEPPA